MKIVATCEECGGGVSNDYVRVFGVNGRVDSCWRCSSRNGNHIHR